MRKNFRKIIALLLVFALMLAYAPAAFAEDGEVTPVEPVYGVDGDFEYAIITPTEGDVYAELVKYNGSDSVVTVPDSFEGTALKVIGHESFFGLQTLKSVTLPDGVEKIDSRAFGSCISMANIILPDSIKEIGDYAFAGCYNAVKEKNEDTGIIETVSESGISYIHLPSSLEIIGDSAFYGCELLVGNAYTPSTDSALLLPGTLKEIGSDAFSQCRSIVNVVIPEGVTEIKMGTFANCAGLESVEIPSTVTHIGVAFNGAFTGHGRFSDKEPTLIIKAPHCIIEDSPTIDSHMTICGATHSSVQAYVDKVNAEREDYLLKGYDDLTGIEADITYVKFVPIEIPGHDFEGTVTVPTCTLRGFTTYVCKQCKDLGFYDDEALSELYVPHECEYTLPLGHKYGAWSEAVEAGCESSGSKYRICKREVTDTAGNVLYAADGVTALTCGYVDTRTVPATGHNWATMMTATCTKKGLSWKECLNCHATRDTVSLAPLGHKFNFDDEEAVIVETIMCEGEGTPAQDGRYVYTCAVCGLVREAVMPAHPDANNDFYCDLCDTFIGTSDVSPDKDCKCNCHNQIGLIVLFYKIQLFFWKLFRVEKVCACGVMHY